MTDSPPFSPIIDEAMEKKMDRTDDLARLRASNEELLKLARDVAAFFKDTDSPMGTRARAAIANAERRA